MRKGASIYVQLPKVAFEKSKLLSSAQYKDLLSAKDLNEFVGKLKNMDYEEIDFQEKASLELIDYGLKEKLITILHKIIRNSPINFQRFFITYLLKFEIENIKLLVKGFYKKLGSEEIKLHESVEQLLGRKGIFKEALAAADLRALITILQKLPYGKLIEEAFANFERENYSFFYFDLFLDLKYLEELWSKHQKLRRNNRTIVREFIGLETDCYNLEVVLRARNLKIEPHLIYKMISSKSFHLNKQFLEELIRDNLSYERLAQIFRISEKMSSLDAQSVPLICKSMRLKLIRSLYVGSVFSIAKSLAFLIHKELEMENLRIISVGIYYKKPIDEISKKLYIV
jgi:vacuolar-type H+-ATPase subunit C/Vma6